MRSAARLLAVSLLAFSLCGCAAALIGGGAVAGYAVAKDMEGGKSSQSKK